MRYYLLIFSLWVFSAAAHEPPVKYMGLAEVSMSSRLGLGATVYGTYTLSQNHSGGEMAVASATVNERGYGLAAGYTGVMMGGGLLFEGGYLNMNRDRFRDGPRDFLTGRASLMFLIAHAGVGVLNSGSSTYGEVFVGVVLPFYPWIFNKSKKVASL